VVNRLEPLIPGTAGHHNMLVNGLQGRVAQEEKNATEEAQQRNLESEAENRGATAEPAAAKTITTDAGIMQWNPASQKYDIPAGKAPAKEHEELSGKTITTDQGIMQWNPETKRYDIKAGESPDKPVKEQGTVHQLEDGTLIIAHPDGTATPVTVNGQPAKGKSPTAKETPLEDRIVQEYIAAHPGTTLAQARRATEANPPDRGTNVIDPATHRLIRVEPGGAVPEGAITPQQAGGEAVAANKTEQAGKDARASAGRAYQLAQKLAADNTGSSDAALLMQFIGATKPEGMARIRFNKSEQDFIQGSRSLIDKAESTLTGIVDKGQRLTPADRQRYLHTMAIIAGQEGGGGGGYKAGDTRVVNGTTYQRDDKGQWHPQAH
jgi:hypothetical protein